MVDKLYRRLLQPPDESFFLLGLRGVGKSAWARSRFPGATRIDLLDEARFHDYLRDPGQFGSELRKETGAGGTW